jgi:hypothetical protein
MPVMRALDENITVVFEDELSAAVRTAGHAAELLRLLGAEPG